MATRNPGKFREIREILREIPVRLVSLLEYPGVPDIVESGMTLRDNALIKARAAFAATGVPSLSDDSGLEVDALGGQPGVRSARFAGEEATYEGNNAKLLGLLAGIPAAARTARFVCVSAFVDGKTEHISTGECEGRIADALMGNAGFGYDPLFVPAGGSQSFAQLSAPAKNQISHRVLAFGEMMVFLAGYFTPRT